MQAVFQALCGLQLLFWSTLGCCLFQENLVIYDKRLLMLLSIYSHLCGLTGGGPFYKFVVLFLFVAFVFVYEACEKCGLASSRTLMEKNQELLCRSYLL